jgi:hypothetical protein
MRSLIPSTQQLGLGCRAFRGSAVEAEVLVGDSPSDAAADIE